jgi:ABC-type lipoprotein release transport system permease subunit
MLAADKMGVHGGDVALGSELWFDNRPWEIVGRFRAPATVMEGEVWMPLTDLQVAARRDTLSCVVATLGTAEFADMDVWAKSRLDLEVTVMAESDYYASLQRFYRPVRWMVWGTAVLMAMAGLLGGLNTLYTAFAARTREVGMLQALGYPRRAIVVTIMQESVLAASAGALLACLVAWLLLDGLAVRFSMGVFQLSVDSSAVALGLFAGLLVGVIGSIPPALQCLRLPIPSALKAI